MPDLYDLKASQDRVARSEKAVDDLQAYIANLRLPERLKLEEANLLQLIEMRAIARKTHAIILEVLLAREAGGAPAAMGD